MEGDGGGSSEEGCRGRGLCGAEFIQAFYSFCHRKLDGD